MMGSGNRDTRAEEAGAQGEPGSSSSSNEGRGKRDKNAALLSMYSIKQHPSGDRCPPPIFSSRIPGRSGSEFLPVVFLGSPWAQEVDVEDEMVMASIFCRSFAHPTLGPERQ